MTSHLAPGRVRRAVPALLAVVPAVAVALTPLVYLLVRTAGAGAARIADELFTERTATLAARSLALAAVVTVACVTIGTALALLVTRTDLPGRRVVGVVAALPLAVPTYVAAFAWLSTVDIFAPAHRFEGFWPAATVLTLCSYPYVYLPVAAALAGTDPAQEEVSRSLGRGPWQTLSRVTLRQIRPAIAAGGLLVALYVLSDFGAVSILRFDTFTLAIFTSVEVGFDHIGAVVLATLLVAITMALLVAETVTRRRASYARLGAGGRPPRRHALGAARWPALAVPTVVAAFALGVPAVSLGRWLAEGVSRPGSLAEIAAAAATSMSVAALGAALTVALALPVGLLAARSRATPGRAAHRGLTLPQLAERLTYVGHALPGLVVGLSMVFLAIAVAYPIYQTTTLLVLGYAALFLPLAVGAIHAAAAQAPPRLEEVARSLGRGPLRVLGTVTVPLVAPGVGAGAALVFLTAMKELPATLMLRPTGMRTLATELWSHTSVNAYAAAAPYAALLVALSAVPTYLLARGGRS